MGTNYFNPNRYSLYAMDAAAEDPRTMFDPGLAPGENIQSAMDTPPPSFHPGEYDLGDVDVSMGPMPTPGKGPSRVRPIVAGLARHLQAGIDAAATPNIAAGGGSDIMRALSQSREMQTQRDMQRDAIQRQRQMQDAQIEENMAQADWYRRRAAAQQQQKGQQATKLVQDKEGNWVDPYTGQIVRPAKAGPRIEVVIGPDGKPTMRPTASPVALAPDAAAAVINAGTAQQNTARPRTSVVVGYDKDGMQTVTQVEQTPQGPVLTSRPTGFLGRVPRQATPAGGGPGAPARVSDAVVKNLAVQLVGEVQWPGASFEQKRQRAKEMLINGVWGEHPMVAANRDKLIAQISSMTDPAAPKAGKTGAPAWQAGGAPGPGGPPPPPPPAVKIFPRARLAEYAAKNRSTEQEAEKHLKSLGYTVR